MPSKKGKGGAKGKCPASKGAGKRGAKRPAPPPSSSLEDELDVDQLAVLDQLLAIEQARGLAPVGARGCQTELRGSGRQRLTRHNFASEILTHLSCMQSQSLQVTPQQSQPLQVTPQ